MFVSSEPPAKNIMSLLLLLCGRKNVMIQRSQEHLGQDDRCDGYQINKFNTLAGKSFSCVSCGCYLEFFIDFDLLRCDEVMSVPVKCKDPVSICIL